jgi:hypothetical protein
MRREPRALVRFGASPWPTVLALLLIAPLTLSPQPVTNGPPLSAFNWCAACGDYAGNDVLNNILLFMPLGMAFAWRGWRAGTRAITAATISLVIELLQVAVIPGRFGSLSDILTNTTGAVLGGAIVWHWRFWVRPSARQARGLAVSTGFVCAGILAITAYFLRLAVPPLAPLHGQWTPDRGVPFPGHLIAAAVDGTPLPKARLAPADAAAFRAASANGAVGMRVDIETGDPVREGFAPIARLVSRREVYLVIGQVPGGFVLAPSLESRAFGFRTLAVRLQVPGLRAGEALAIDGRVDRRRIALTVDRAGSTLTTHEDFTVGWGWALLVPHTMAMSGPLRVVSMLWLAVLALPSAYYAGRAAVSTHHHGDAAGGLARTARMSWLFVTPLTLAIGLGLVPLVVGGPAAAWHEWLGGAAGWGVGTLAALAGRFAPLRRLAWQAG